MDAIRKKFGEIFSGEPLVVAAPGRVNLIGEHTDYNQGFVLPGAVDKKMYVALVPNGTDTVNAYAGEYRQTYSFPVRGFGPEKMGDWHAYIKGVVYFIQQKGGDIGGVDVVFDGDVPVGAGMSSSAALCSAFGFALNEQFGLGLSRMDLAYIGQLTEHKFVGAQVGIMDQFASLHGKAGHVMKLDCRSMQFEYIPFHFPEYKIVMVNSMVKHSLGDSEYNVRRKQCEAGVETMKKFLHSDIQSLRDVPLDALKAHQADMDATVYNRCLYVLTENERLQQGCELLQQQNLKGFGALMYETHKGLSKLYEVSCAELDFLAEEAHGFKGVAGTRMMGGGFGGCTINLVSQEAVDGFIAFIKEKYQQRFNKATEVYITQIEDGAKLI